MIAPGLASQVVSQDVFDARRHPRIQVGFKVLRRAGSDYVAERGVDISRGGLSLSTPAVLLPGSDLELVVRSTDGAAEVALRGRVQHVRGLDHEPPFVVGVRLVEVEAPGEYERVVRGLFDVPERRREKRRVEVRSEAIWSPESGAPVQVRLVNLSGTGALVEGPGAPQLGSRGKLSLICVSDGEMHDVPCHAVWFRATRERDRSGLRFTPGPGDAAFIDRVIDGFLFSSAPHRQTSSRAPEGRFRVGDFEVEALIASGGMAEIYRGHAMRGPHAFRPLALKRLRPEYARDLGWVERFRTEADLGRLVQHPAVVRVHTMFEFGGECWMAMELVEGHDLARLLDFTLRRGARPPLRAMVAVVAEIADALDHCHRLRTPSGRELGLVHGDVSLSNVMITPSGTVRLLDFGVATMADSDELSARGVVAGKLEYLPPERLEGVAATKTSDVYQAGVLLYEALCGVRPFKGETAEAVLRSIKQGAVPPSKLRADIPSALDQAILAALHPDPRRRTPDARALAESLRESGTSPSPEEGSALLSTFYERAIGKPQLWVPPQAV